MNGFLIENVLKYTLVIFMNERNYLDLIVKKTIQPDKYMDVNLFIKPDRYIGVKNELIDFLEKEKHLCTKAFAKKVMFSHEIKANNQIEGYGDDIEVIKQVIEKTKYIKDLEKRQRILNLYHGYNYILRTKEINKETLKKLYSILSKDLLDPRDLSRMGQYYRAAPVYILKKGRLDIEPYQGISYEKIDEFMDRYFDFLNRPIDGDITDEYIKSQILHYYFVYIHPYFDVNGRTSRTVSMWYLLNQKSFPYIIFNRGISFKECEYTKVIEDVRKYCDLSYFINYMLSTVKVELEKEYIMQQEANLSNSKFTGLDYQTLLYFLTLNGLKTVLDFTNLYNKFNDKKSVKEIYETMIVPLLDKGVLDIDRKTKKNMFSDSSNVVLKLRNKDEIDREKVKRLIL